MDELVFCKLSRGIHRNLGMLSSLFKLGSRSPRRHAIHTKADKPAKSDKSDKGFEHTVKSGDTLSGIIAAYREQNIKVNKEQIMAANPGLVPEKMRLGQKIWIPAPQQ